MTLKLAMVGQSKILQAHDYRDLADNPTIFNKGYQPGRALSIERHHRIDKACDENSWHVGYEIGRDKVNARAYLSQHPKLDAHSYWLGYLAQRQSSIVV